MTIAKWDFPALNGGTEQGYTNSGIETFRGADLTDNLAREICQNSLDAKDTDSKEPVVVEFDLMTINKDNHPLFKEYAECIAGCKKYWENRSDKKVKSFIERVESVLAKDEIKVLRISDYNTTGLTGSDANENQESVWRALVNADGVSAKNTDTAGGSYGIGKNAPFACSDISVVFYNTYAKDNKSAFQGVARAATLYKEDNNNKIATQGIGHYRSTENYKPVTGNECSFKNLFSRNKYGTDIIIVGCEKLTEEKNWQDKLEQAVVRNFLLAVFENKLVVKIGDKTINQDNLKDIIEQYRKMSSNAAAQTVRLFDTIISPDGEPKTETIITDNDLEIYLKQNPTYKREIAKFRTTGMLVGTDKRRMMQNFTAVVVVRGEKLGEILRLAEPPKHNKWDHKLIEDKATSLEAKKYIDEINNKVKKLIDENYKMDVEDTVDADVGEYLPDELEDLINKNKQAGNDKLRPVQKILGKPKVMNFPKDSNTELAKQEDGEVTESDSETRNNGKNPEPYPEPKVPQPVNPTSDGETKGTSEGQGPKIHIQYPALKSQRMVAVNYEQGLYKLVLIPLNTCEKIFVDFSAIGEGSSGEDIKVDKCMVNKQPININGSKIGPVTIDADEKNEIFVTFKNKEKMVINMEITEEVRK